MKKIVSILCVLMLSVGMASCSPWITVNVGGKAQSSDTQEQVLVVEEKSAVSPTPEASSPASSSSSSTAGSESSTASAPVQTSEKTIRDLELQVQYYSGGEYELQYELKRDGREEYELEDDLNGVYAEGSSVKSYMEALLAVSYEDLSDDEIVAKVLELQSLSGDYREFQLQIQYTDGTKRKIKRYA